MRETANSPTILTFRARLEAARGGLGHTQELPARAAWRAGVARTSRALDSAFARLNPEEGLLVPASLRPNGVLWRLHPDCTPAGPAVARTSARLSEGAIA